MNKRIFLYDSFGFDFYACYYEGQDADGKARLTMMTPGKPVVDFQRYLTEFEEDASHYHLLCEEGKPADSKMIIEMLAHVFLNSTRPYEKMAERLNEMWKFGISYDREPQKLTVKLYVLDDDSYNIEMYIGDMKFIDNCVNDKSLGDVIVDLSGFFYFMKTQVHIPVTSRLESCEALKKQVKRLAPHLFDEFV